MFPNHPTMIFRQSSSTMASSRTSATADDTYAFGLPVLRKSISEPGLPTVGHHRNPVTINRSNVHSASVAAAPKITVSKVSTSATLRRHPAYVQLDVARRRSQTEPSAAGGAHNLRSIDMINARKFPAVMSKHYLRRRSTSGDVQVRGESSHTCQHVNGLCVTNGKYGSPAGPLDDRGGRHDRSYTLHQSFRSDDQVIDRGGMQHNTARKRASHDSDAGIALPEVVWRTTVGTVTPSGTVTNTDYHGGRSSVGSWQTYPLSSRPCYNQRHAQVLRGNTVMHPHGSPPEHGYNINPNTRTRTRFFMPSQVVKTTASTANDPGSTNLIPDTEQLTAPPQTSVAAVSKPTMDLLQRNRALTRGDRINANRNNVDSGVMDGKGANDQDDDNDDDDEDNMNIRVRHWLSSLDSTLCQRYARRQMATLRDYESPNNNNNNKST